MNALQLTEQETREVAHAVNSTVDRRASLAATSTSVQTLWALAHDEAVDIQQAVARNEATNGGALEYLTLYGSREIGATVASNPNLEVNAAVFLLGQRNRATTLSVLEHQKHLAIPEWVLERVWREAIQDGTFREVGIALAEFPHSGDRLLETLVESTDYTVMAAATRRVRNPALVEKLKSHPHPEVRDAALANSPHSRGWN